MFAKPVVPSELCGSIASPVAILDKELLHADSFRLKIFELCSQCGARFGIGFLGRSKDDSRFAAEASDEVEELPGKLTAILAKDHRQHRQHKDLIELDF